MAPKKKDSLNGKLIADNRKARHNFEFLDTLEAGLMLTGTEVKSLRNIPEYLEGNRNNHNPRRRRKLLLHKKEMSKLIGGVQREGLTIVPSRLFFNERGIAKLQIALALMREKG